MQKLICAAAMLPRRETNYNASAVWLRKLMVIGRRNNFCDEVRRIKSKMYPPEIMGAGAARFEFDNDGRLDIFLVTTGRSTAKWNGSAMSQQAAI
jgi:hypothetical protein